MEKEFEKILGLFKTDKIVTQKDIDAVLSGVLQLLTQFKSDTYSLNEDTKKQVEKLLTTVLEKYQSQNADINQAKTEFKDLKTSIKSTFEKSVEEINYLISEFKKMKPKDGETPDVNIIVAQVMEQINAQEKNEDESSEISGEDIIDKINELDYSEENQIDWQRIKNVPDFMEAIRTDTSGFERRNITVISNAVDLDTTARADGYAIVWDATNKRHKYAASGGGGGMSIGGSITSATKGSVLFAGASGVLAQNNTKLYWDNTNYRLGVGTQSTARTLAVNASMGFLRSDTLAEVLAITVNSNGVYFDTTSGNSNGRYIWSVAGTERMRLSGANLGIGTNVPDVPLHVQDGNTAITELTFTSALFSNVSATTNDTRVGLIAGTAGETYLDFGDLDDLDIGGIKYNHSTNSMAFVVNTLDAISIASTGVTTITNTTDQQTNQVLVLRSLRATPANSDRLDLSFVLNNSSSAVKEYARIQAVVSTVTAGSETGILDFFLTLSGTSAAKMRLAPTNLTPSSAGLLALGSSSTGWSGLYLNTGGIINIANSDWVATHTTGILTVGTGDLRVTTAGTNTASVVTVGGIQTLTNKTFTSPKIGTSILDTNGVALLALTATASAVNYLTLANSATTTAPSLSATGSDTNIDISLIPKGTGIVKGTYHRFSIRLVDATTDVATGTTIGGDIRIANRAITIKAVGAYNDTAGTTGTMTIDINDSGSTIMTTNKINIDSTQKTSTTAGTQPTLTDTSIGADAIVTIDVDAVHTTKAKGLVVWIDYVYA